MTDYENIPISNNFMFGKIMQDPERCRMFLETILNFKIHHVEILDREKYLDEKFDGHGIRMDIYAEDGKTIYDCEMQTTDEHNLPKRSRYYQGQIDLTYLKSGENYSKLKRTYVIFVCTFDPFGCGKCIYHFENLCIDDSLIKLKDESIKIFINTKGSTDGYPEDFRELLHFLDSSEITEYNSKLVRDMSEALLDARSNRKWRHDYMTFELFVKEAEYRAAEKAEKEGFEKGKLQAFCQLISDGILTEEIAAQEMGISVDEFHSMMEEYMSPAE